MIATMTLELSDKPGQLLDALRPIADHNGNIVSVRHQRGDVTPRGTLPVEITFEILEERLETLVDDIHDQGIRVAKLGEERFHESVTVVLVGHIVESGVTDTIEEIESPGVKIVDFSLAMPDESGETSSARLVINATGEDTLQEAVDSIKELCEDKELVDIGPIGVS
ncbi:MAG: amino acid-binding protein [Halobacteria archaeon]